MLLAQPQLLDQYAVTVGIARLQVVEELPPPRHHPQQAAPRVMIFDIALEVIIEAIDARGQQRDLNLGRPGIAARVPLEAALKAPPAVSLRGRTVPSVATAMPANPSAV